MNYQKLHRALGNWARVPKPWLTTRGGALNPLQSFTVYAREPRKGVETEVVQARTLIGGELKLRIKLSR
jgi:hypothetical protein